MNASSSHAEIVDTGFLIPTINYRFRDIWYIACSGVSFDTATGGSESTP